MEEFKPIQVSSQIFLGLPQQSDIPGYVELLREREIYLNTLRIPFPYTKTHAQEWIELTHHLRRQGYSGNFAIRNSEGLLLGGAGFSDLKVGESFKSEIGYWLGNPTGDGAS